ncbi:DKNYY domain-containing protein [Flavobacterium sp. GCM10027622]|uniref:DKNYY domain-containing protein n=1 Tax=unclassified Flavobacterium TaxID=196869 RepID=UPI00361CC420
MHKKYIPTLLLLTALSALGQTRMEMLRSGLNGNTIAKLVQDEEDKGFFTDPVDDTLNFNKVIDNIYKDKKGKVYLLTGSFRPIAKDTAVYFEYYKDISDFLELKTYKSIKNGFFQNKNKVYIWWENSDGNYPIEVKGAHAKTFVPFDSICGGYDKKHVFYGGGPDDFEIIKGADPKTIKVVNPKKGCWNCNNCYFIDRKSVYFGVTKINVADPNTFQLVNTETVDAEDKNGYYVEGKRISNK